MTPRASFYFALCRWYSHRITPHKGWCLACSFREDSLSHSFLLHHVKAPTHAHISFHLLWRVNHSLFRYSSLKLFTAEHIRTKWFPYDPPFGYIIQWSLPHLLKWPLWLILDLFISFLCVSVLGVCYVSGVAIKVTVSLLWTYIQVRDMFYRARETYTYSFLIIFSLKVLEIKLEISHQENASTTQIGRSMLFQCSFRNPWENMGEQFSMCNPSSENGLLYHPLLVGFGQV